MCAGTEVKRMTEHLGKCSVKQLCSCAIFEKQVLARGKQKVAKRENSGTAVPKV